MIRARSWTAASPSSGPAAASAAGRAPARRGQPRPLRRELVADGRRRARSASAAAARRRRRPRGRASRTGCARGRPRSRRAQPSSRRRRREPGEQLLGLRAAPVGGERAGQCEPGVERGRPPAPRRGEALGQRRVGRRQRRARRAREQRGVPGGARLEPPRRHPQQVAVPPVRRCAATASASRASGSRRAGRGEPRAHRLAVQRMRQVGEPPPRRGPAVPRAPRARAPRGPAREQVQLERRATASDSSWSRAAAPTSSVRRSTSCASRVPASSGPRQRQTPPSSASSPRSTPWRASSRTNRALPRVSSQIALEVAPSTGRAEARGEQRLDVVACQRAQLEHGAQLVLPERPHGVRHRPPLPHGDDRERLAGRHELVQERGRGGVEQVPVVDAQDQPPSGRALRQRVARAREPLGAAGQRRRRQQRRRTRRAGARPRNASRAPTPPRRPRAPRPRRRAGSCRRRPGRSSRRRRPSRPPGPRRRTRARLRALRAATACAESDRPRAG